MTALHLTLTLAILTAVGYYVSADLKVGAFNIQVFGVTKMKKPEVVDTLVKIIRRYDIMFIQEIRDSSGKAIQKLLKDVNQNQPQERMFSMILGPRLGTSVSKEQYAYLCRGAGLTLKESYTYNDVNKAFEREPMVAIFDYNGFEFALVGIHVDPDLVIPELNALSAVVEDVRYVRRNNVNNVMILGDLNADCSYMPVYKRKDIRLRTDKEQYTWLIHDHVDTTIKSTHCAYDRFIAAGDQWNSSIVAGSVTVYRFDSDYGLTEKQAAKVSDHYPIEFTLRVGYTTQKLPNVYIYLTNPRESLSKSRYYSVTAAENKLQMQVFDGSVNVGWIKHAEVNLYLFDVYRVPGARVAAKPVASRYRGRQRADIFIKLPV